MNMNTDTSVRIRQQAHELFMRFGWKSVSMDDIAARMAISKKTIYQFYEDKESLVAEVVNQIILQNQQQCDEDIVHSENAIHEIMLAMQQMSKLFHQMNPSIIFDLQKYYPAAFSIFVKHKNDFVYNKIKNNIQRGISEGYYRDNLDVEIVSRFRVESIVIAFNPEFQQNVQKGLVNIAQELSTFFLYGVANEKGHKLIKKYIHIQ